MKAAPCGHGRSAEQPHQQAHKGLRSDFPRRRAALRASGVDRALMKLIDINGLVVFLCVQMCLLALLREGASVERERERVHATTDYLQHEAHAFLIPHAHFIHLAPQAERKIQMDIAVCSEGVAGNVKGSRFLREACAYVGIVLLLLLLLLLLSCSTNSDMSAPLDARFLGLCSIGGMTGAKAICLHLHDDQLCACNWMRMSMMGIKAHSEEELCLGGLLLHY